MKQNKKIWLVTLAIAFTLALFSSCARRGNNYYIRQLIAGANNYNTVPLAAQANNYNPGPSVAQVNNYYLGPSVSVINGTLTVQTIGTTSVYALKTACPIKVSNNNIIVNNISMFQLTGCGPNAAPYIGGQVWLTGKFFLGCTANNDTQLMMEVSKFEAFTTVPVSQGYVQSNTQGYEQGYEQGYTQGYTQGKEQSKAQGGTQINTQINAQGNAQVNAQINTQINTKNSTQGNTLNAGKPVTAAAKAPAKKTEPASVATKPKPKPVTPCPPPKTKTYRIQVGAFCDPANAQKAMTRLKCQNLNPVKEKYKQYTRVVLKGIPATKVEITLAAVKKAGFDETWKQLE